MWYFAVQIRGPFKGLIIIVIKQPKIKIKNSFKNIINLINIIIHSNNNQKNQDSNVNGKEYIMYQGGHSVADIDGTLYDATTGVMPASLNDPDYVIGEKLSDKYRCNEEGAWLYKFDFEKCRCTSLLKNSLYQL